MGKELKRRDLSGIYIFDTFPGEEKRQPTCIEDCQQETRRKWCMTKIQDCLRDTIKHLAQTFKDITDYLVTEKCVSNEQRTQFFDMIDSNVEKSKWNWSLHELADQVDFFCKNVTLLADAKLRFLEFRVFRGVRYVRNGVTFLLHLQRRIIATP